ncbi:MAG TPA: hypothetical protein VM510_03420 [Caulifigura sp.]|nr:hypothetical protein [Caulifigura sp.]
MAKSPLQRLKDQYRAIDRQCVPELHRQQGGRCFWCGARVAIARLVAKTKRLALNHEVLTRPNGRRSLIATLDHLDGVMFRGADKRLVVACYPCNRARASVQLSFAAFLLQRCRLFGRNPPRQVQRLIARWPETGVGERTAGNESIAHEKTRLLSQAGS